MNASASLSSQLGLHSKTNVQVWGVPLQSVLASTTQEKKLIASIYGENEEGTGLVGMHIDK